MTEVIHDVCNVIRLKIPGKKYGPPHSLVTEYVLLRAIIFDNKNFECISKDISANDFFSYENREIYKAICELVRRDKPIDFKSVEEISDSRFVCAEYIATLFFQNPPEEDDGYRYENILASRDILRERGKLRRSDYGDDFGSFCPEKWYID